MAMAVAGISFADVDSKCANLSGYTSPSFAGPALAGALVDARFQPFLDNLWNLNASKPATGYYDYELQLLSMIVATGNWWNPAELETFQLVSLRSEV